MSDRDLLDEQIAYYRARAAEYDATSRPTGDPFADHAAALRATLRTVPLSGRVIEIAAGTGQWTGLLAERAEDLFVTDASPEMLVLNRAKLGDRSNVRYAVCDAFALAATRDRDVAFAGFFLSHVPPSRFRAFWTMLHGLLRRGGRVVFVDERRHGLWHETWEDELAGIVRRRLNDGSEHRAVKVLWDPPVLERALRDLGWDASVRAEGPFYLGTAQPSPVAQSVSTT